MAVLTRAQIIADARALLDFLEAHPEVPINEYRGIEASYHPAPSKDETDAEEMAAVDAIADMLGSPVTTPATAGSHYETEIRFGSASYRAVSVLKDYRDRYDAIQSLGEAALAEQETAKRDKPCTCPAADCQAADHVDYDEIADVLAMREEMALEAAGVESWDEL